MAEDAGTRHKASQKELEQLARQVIDLARGEVVASHPYLAQALGMLELRFERMGRKFSTDGRTLWADPGLVLADFARTGKAPTHDLVHVTLHCLLLHPFAGGEGNVDQAAWDLATDIVVERLAAEMLGPREGERGQAISLVMEQLRDSLGAEPTVERVYRALRGGRFANAARTWQTVLAVDDPARWFPERSETGEERGEGSEDQSGARQRSSSGAPDEGGGGEQHPGQSGETPREPDGHGGGDYRDGLSGAADVRGGAEDADGTFDAGTEAARRLSARERAEARERWRRAARSLRVDLETTSRSRGDHMGSLTRELAVGTRRREDLRGFLRKFATLQERVRVSPDEFDYVFYTLGLSLFGDMPLIEPLEYREERTIRTFALVIDTSGSVEGPAVQRFVDVAFDVLTSQVAFGARTDVHVIQADAGVQEDVRIASREDLERWRRGFVLKGLGGTDFRPAFAYVDGLLETGELADLDGLVYLTDGRGTFPSKPPRYKTAFVLYDGGCEPPPVPSWAMRLVLDEDELGDTGENAGQHDSMGADA